MEIRDLGSLQIRVLEMLWERGEATAGDLWEAWPDRPRAAYTTVLSALQKLHRRKLVARRKCGRAHAYTARIAREEFRRACVDELRGQVFGGSAAGLVAALLGGERLDDREIDEIRRLVRERGKERRRG
ncbi:MAG: BlaI/MecI/CopY family transcriptional regulator [Planctomycetes bacterium]|nr:BlaI/MecI/CopY family transcriptional regulator [Planctomycetota bacterium]